LRYLEFSHSKIKFKLKKSQTVLLDKRDKLVNNLKLNESELSRDLPVLIEVLKQRGNGSSSLSSSFSKEIKRDVSLKLIFVFAL
jgi:hypothetical protein